MKELTLKQAAEDCRGTLTPEQAEGMITGVQIDSRRVKPGDLFVAIKGEKSDGHDFIGMAASLGASAALVQRPVKAAIPTILVPDTIKAYGDLAAARRERMAGRPRFDDGDPIPVAFGLGHGDGVKFRKSFHAGAYPFPGRRPIGSGAWRAMGIFRRWQARRARRLGSTRFLAVFRRRPQQGWLAGSGRSGAASGCGRRLLRRRVRR